jgi:hypothetical protein
MKTNLKVVLSAIALAALVAAPAVAKSRTQQHTGQAPAYSNNTVVQDGQVLGADPDGFIRSEIRRDGTWYKGE